MKIKIGNIEAAVVQRVGNKSLGDGISFASELSPMDLVEPHLKTLIASSFKFEDLRQFYAIDSLEFNRVYRFVTNIFKNDENIIEQSNNLARHLYEQSEHPKIKVGEFYVVYFRNCEFDGKNVDAVGLFKSENYETVLKILMKDNSLSFAPEKGIGLHKLDKGCIVFNIEKESGYRVFVVDNVKSGSDAHYWVDKFLQVCPCHENYNQTQNMIKICKSFIEKIPNDSGKIDKVNYMNRSLEALKEESVNVSDLVDKVFDNKKLASDFKQYKETYQKENGIEIDDTFVTDIKAVKRKYTGSLTTIKLDKNFDISVRSGEELITRGYDKERGMHYYQLFFKEER